MNSYQRLNSIMAHEGISGLSRRIIHKLFVKEKQKATPNQAAVEKYHKLVKNFHFKVQEMGYGDIVKDYFWYHTVDLGNGLITPGAFDYRSDLALFKFPDDMKGMNVLDVGSATGFFAFEFERRGANVVSIEVSTMADYDRFPGETVQQNLKKLERAMPYLSSCTPEQADYIFRTKSLEELHHLILDGPFKFCHKLLNSKVQRCYSNIYDLTKEKVGRDDFDLVFLGDILVHTLYPLKALAVVASLCRGSLIIFQEVPDTSSKPAMLYRAGDELGGDDATWWLPNRLCFEQMLKKLGFNKIAIVNKCLGFLQPVGFPYERTILRATK